MLDVVHNLSKKLSYLLTIIFLTACGGGGGGGSEPAPVPAPTPAPTYEFEGQIYWPLEFESAKVCIDFNFNNSCDSDEINQLSTGWTENGDFHKFKLTTQNTSTRDRINNGYERYLVEINQQTGRVDQQTKLNHPSKKLIDELYGDIGIHISPLSSLHTQVFGADARWTPSIWSSDTSFIRHKVLVGSEKYAKSIREQIIDKYDDETPYNIFTEPGSAYICCSTKERNNAYLEFLSKVENVREAILDEVKTEIEEDEAFQELVNNSDIGPLSFSSAANFPERVNRIFLSQNFPNDTTGSYTALNQEQTFSMPLQLGLQAEFDIGNNGWKARVYSFNDVRVALSNNELKLSKQSDSCDIDPSYSCFISINANNLDRFSSGLYNRSTYTNIASDMVNVFADTYRYYGYPDTGQTYDCRNWESIDQIKFDNSSYTHYQLDTELDAWYDGWEEVCNSYSSPEQQWVEAFRFFEDGDEVYSSLYFDCAYRDPCSDYTDNLSTYEFWDILGTAVNSGSSIPTKYTQLFNGLIFSLDQIGDVIEIIQQEQEYSYFAIEHLPNNDPRGHELFIRSDSYSFSISYIGCNFRPSAGGWEPLLYYDYPSDAQIDEVIDFCAPYFSRDFVFEDVEIRSGSPYMRRQTVFDLENENIKLSDMRSSYDMKRINRKSSNQAKTKDQINKTSNNDLVAIIKKAPHIVQN